MRSEQISLIDAVEFIVDNRGKTVPIEESGFPLIATNCISNLNLYPEFTNIRYISQDTFNTWFRAHPEPDDVIITNKGSQNGAICLVPNPVTFVIAQDMVALRAKRGIIFPKYLFAVLRSKKIQEAIKNLNVDSVIPHFKKTDFNKLFLPKPNYEIQKVIGNFYFLLSSKIELNRKMNQTLEEMAQAIFKSWFVDFDLVHAKMACTNEKELQQAAKELGISKEILDLFPNEFEESELGMIPKGWEVGTFASNCKIVYGKNLPTTKLVESGYEVYGGNGIIGYHSQYLYDKQQVLIACRGAASGAVHISNPYSFVTNNSLIIELLEQSILNFEYMSELAKSSDFTIYVTGSAQPQITIQSINGHKFIIPNENLLLSWKKLIEHSKILLNSNEVDVLRKTRDTLLPKLLSGELDVSNINL